MKISKSQLIIFLLYFIFNFYAFIFVSYTSNTIGDFSLYVGFSYLNIIAFILSVLPFFVFLLIYNYWVSNRKYCLNDYTYVDSYSLILVFFQLGYVYFNISEGVNSAGSQVLTSNPLRFLFIAFNPDFLFLILCGVGRDSKYFKANYIIYFISNLSRGWLGPLIILAAIEFYYILKERDYRKLNFLIFICFFILLLSPYLISLKWVFRAYFGGTGTDLTSNLNNLFFFADSSYFEQLLASVHYIISRFQIYSNLLLILHNRIVFEDMFFSGEFVGVFNVGLPQYLFYTLFDVDYNLFTSTVASFFSREIVSFNTHVGWFGWVLFNPYLFPLYFLYSIILVLISYKATNFLKAHDLHFITWFLILMLLLQGWIGTFIIFIISLFQVLLFRLMFRYFFVNK